VCKKVPKNYIILFIYTLCESILLSFICSVAQPEVVLLAAGILVLLVGGLIIYALKTQNDIT
jgi:FtsH-binding integral membrane protein